MIKELMHLTHKGRLKGGTAEPGGRSWWESHQCVQKVDVEETNSSWC